MCVYVFAANECLEAKRLVCSKLSLDSTRVSARFAFIKFHKPHLRVLVTRLLPSK